MNLLHSIDPKDTLSFSRNPYPPGFEKSTVPEGTVGDWAVQRFTVTEKDIGLANLRALRDGNPRRVIPPGDYTRLVHKGEGIVMGDTPAEAWEHNYALHRAHGDVLVNGLGLGFYLAAILKKPEVTSVTVIERSPDVIALVAPYFTDPRVKIIEADALTWRPARGVRFGYVWHDIWTNITEDNRAEMTKLRRAYGRRTEAQGCWGEEYMR